MPRTSEGRVFDEEEAPTGKVANEQLDVLVARSVQKSTMFNASLDSALIDAIPRAAGPTPTSPEFLGKSTAVLVVPPEVEPAPSVSVEPPVAVVPPVAIKPPVAIGPPAVGKAPAAAADTPVASARERSLTRPTAKARSRAWRHVVKLVLLALVVVCQPWWWNVGDLTAHRAVPVLATR